jgi:hypothetical protein
MRANAGVKPKLNTNLRKKDAAFFYNEYKFLLVTRAVTPAPRNNAPLLANGYVAVCL